MATNFVRIGTEHQVNLPNSTNGDQFDPDVAALTDGRFFVAYEDEDSPSDGEIIGQFVNADGALSGSPFYVEGDPGDQDNPAVAARPGGGAIVV